MIASDAEAAKNRLSTDTPGWSDIRNKAESGGSQFGLNVSGGVAQNSQSGGYQATTGETAKDGQSGGYKGTPGGLPSASLAHVSESASSTTHSAVAAGDIIIRDPAKQQQDVAELSRDTANAHQALENNFDRQKIQDSLEIQQQATALGTQAMTVYMDSKLDAAKQQVRDDMAARGELNGLSETEIDKKVTASPEFKAADKEYGIGSPFWTTSSAMTGLLAGVLGGNVQGGMAAGAAPVLAKLVKDASGENEAARIALHTVVSAALAKAQGGNATAGAIGGLLASAGAERFAEAIYGKKADALAPDEKMVVFNLVAAFSAAGGGVAAGDTAGMVSAGNAARVEVENNFLHAEKITSFIDAQAKAKTPEEKRKLQQDIDKLDKKLQAQAEGWGISTNDMKSALAGLKALEDSPECNAQCQGMVRDSINKLKPALENRISKHSSHTENLKELTGILATAIVMNESGLIVGRTTTSGSGKGVSGSIGADGAVGIGKTAAEATAAKAEAVAANPARNNPSWKAGDYLDDFKPSATPLELVKEQAGKGSQTAYIRMDHILNGEVKTFKDGTKVGSGGHYIRDPNIKIDKVTGTSDANGVSTGYISVRDPATGKWVNKKAETIFFPEHWSKRQTAWEIESAFKNSTNIPGTQMWTGKSSSGLEIEGFYGKPDGTGASAWPVYKGGK